MRKQKGLRPFPHVNLAKQLACHDMALPHLSEVESDLERLGQGKLTFSLFHLVAMNFCDTKIPARIRDVSLCFCM